MDKLNLPSRKVGGKVERATLSRYLCSAVVRKGRTLRDGAPVPDPVGGGERNPG